MPLKLTLARSVYLPALWLDRERFDRMSHGQLIAELDAVGDEFLIDAGGAANVVRAVAWTAPLASATDRLDVVIANHVRRIVETSRTDAEAARRLGVNTSTVFRWRQRATRMHGNRQKVADPTG